MSTDYGTILVRGGTTEQWAASTRPLMEREFGRDTTTGEIKMGNGADLWADLVVVLDETQAAAAVTSGGALDVALKAASRTLVVDDLADPDSAIGTAAGEASVMAVLQAIEDGEIAAGVDPSRISIASRVAGTIIGWLGTSLTNGSNSTNASVYSFRAQTRKIVGAKVSGSSINAGVPGERSDQILARVPGVIAAGAQFLFIEAGTNSAGALMSLADYSADIIAMKELADAAGLPVVFGATPPRSALHSVAIRQLTNEYNLWLKFWSAANGVPIVDLFAAIVDPATGLLSATYDDGDGTHPNNAGHLKMAEAIAAVLGPLLPMPAWPVVSAGIGMTTDPLATTTTSWFTAGGAAVTRSLVAAAPGELPAGQWHRWSQNNSAGGSQALSTQVTNLSVQGVDWDTGDVLLLALYIRASVPTAINKIGWADGSTILSTPFEIFPNATPGPLMATYTVPSRTWGGALRLAIVVRSGAGETVTVDAGGKDVYNLTRGGLVGTITP